MKKLVTQQSREKVDDAYKRLNGLVIPPEGWLRTLRRALWMSGAQLAARLGVSKARVSKAELDELEGRVTLKSMQSMAEAMGCRFVYAIVPDEPVEGLVRQRALEKAGEQVKQAAVHMALEDQATSQQQLEYQVERVAHRIMEEMPAYLWNDE